MTEMVDMVCVSDHCLTADHSNLYVPANFTEVDILCRRQIQMVRGGGLEYLSETK